jgi:hypothetical protein
MHSKRAPVTAQYIKKAAGANALKMGVRSPCQVKELQKIPPRNK